MALIMSVGPQMGPTQCGVHLSRKIHSLAYVRLRYIHKIRIVCHEILTTLVSGFASFCLLF